MSTYKVKVVTRIGTSFLSRGQSVREENAKWYHHPSGARRAAYSYAAKVSGGASEAARVMKFSMIDRHGDEVEIT